MTATLTPVNRQEQARAHDGGRVVVGVDDSPGGLTALRRAIAIARSRGAPLVAVRVWELGLPRHGGRRRSGHGHLVLAFTGEEQRQVAAALTRRAFRAAAGGIPRDLDVVIETPEGNPGPVLTKLASGDGDVLVVGTTGRPSVKRAVHGSVSGYCDRHARCAVTVAARPSHRSRGHWGGPA